ncbi:uncharacterized protein LOC143470863 [Clavelina lepadiformis]|uniref:uncharacterized protein LOC143470863 n=1 Tax=Clavelina lepadiformis TaxID=159417 RepID=UPI00404342CB
MFQQRKHERQQDGLNCGPLALKEAQRILNESSCEEQIDFDTDSETCKNYRMDFGNLLLDSTDYDVLLSFCNICHNQDPSEVDQQKTEWIECSLCCRWVHQNCVPLIEHLSQEYFCSTCKKE